MSKRTIGADGLDELPGNEVEDVPVWHAIVGEGWEPVLFGETTKQEEEVLIAGGWAGDRDNGGFIYATEHRPRRRRKRLYEIRTMIGGAQYSCIKRVKVGDRFRLIEGGVLIPVDKPPTQSAE